MKTLSVAVFVLCLTPVCQAASLACEKLEKPVDKDPDLSGKWHYIALSTEGCLTSTLINVLFWPSVAMDITAKSTPNIYDANVKVKMYGICVNQSQPFLYSNHRVFDVNRKNDPTGEGDVLLQTSCPDCFVVKGTDTIGTLTLFSRRKSVDAAELREFEKQAECLGWSKPQVLNTDHDYENCMPLNDDDTVDEQVAHSFFNKMYERVKSMCNKITKCIIDTLVSYFPFLQYFISQ